ncbi:hypothetical protein [Mesorhizobium sp. Cs1299R1N3]|uniref:hypothetical protein n=1 Tax=Mesorhizobium sp. Cs1299R1N3 TaxID=3015173 RepID=UPI00301E12E3
MVFGNRTLIVHLAKGIGGFGALAIALETMNSTLLPSAVLLPLSLYLLRGCPVCWTIGLFETVATAFYRTNRVKIRDVTSGEAE